MAVHPAGGHPDVAVGGRAPYVAVASLQDGRDYSCTATAAWSSSDPTVALVEKGGWVTGLRAGPVALTAVCWGISGSLQETVREGSALSGSVRDPEGRPLPNASVSVTGRWKGGWFTDTDSDGAYRVGGMPRGETYTVTASKAGYQRSNVQMTLEAAEARRDFALRVGVQVFGEVLEPGGGPLPGAIVEVLSGPNAGRKTATSENGYFELSHLLPGTLTLRASKAGYVPDQDVVEAFDDVSHRFELTRSLGTCLSPIMPRVVDRIASAAPPVGRGLLRDAVRRAPADHNLRQPSGMSAAGRLACTIRVPAACRNSRTLVITAIM